MATQPLDSELYRQHRVSGLPDIKRVLTEMGKHTFYEHKDGYLILEQGDAVSVALRYEGDAVHIKPRFPTIGNALQVFSSAVILAIFLFVIPVIFPLQWIFAVLGGQLISYLVYRPKTLKLKRAIELRIMNVAAEG